MKIVYILIGWLRGILSPIIVNKISNKHKKVALQKMITEELKDVKQRLVYIPLQVYPFYGDLDLKHFKWIEEQTNNFTEFISSDDEKEQLKKIYSNQDIKAENIVKLFNAKKNTDNPSFHFKKMEISIADSNQGNFEILDNHFLKKFLGIKFHIRTFNEEVQSVNEYIKMTFDSSISETNHQIITKNIKRKNYTISEKAILIVENINKII